MNKRKNKTTIKISAGQSWLDAWDRKYPVIIDPDLEIEGSQPSMDSRGIVAGSAQGTTFTYEEKIGRVGNDQKQFVVKINRLPELFQAIK